MEDLLPKELLAKILNETGGTDPGKAAHLVKTVTNFRRFAVPPRAVEELDLNRFTPVFDRFAAHVQSEWQRSYAEAATIARKEQRLTNLRKYRFREESVAGEITCAGFSEPGFFFMHPATFYFIMNRYFGGGTFRSELENHEMTAVEKEFMRRLTQNLVELLAKAMRFIAPLEMSLNRLPAGLDVQVEWLDAPMAVCDLIFAEGDRKMHFSVVLPEAWLRNVVKRVEQADEFHRKSDPMWQKAVRENLMNSTVTLKAELGVIAVPFMQSVNLKVGDVLPWNFTEPRVTLTLDGRQRFIGMIGKVDGNYAIRVDETMK